MIKSFQAATRCSLEFTYTDDYSADIPMYFYIITGGTPALSFGDYSFTKRYPSVEKFSNKNWVPAVTDRWDENTGRRLPDIVGHYQHQGLQGKLSIEDLPGGEETIKAYLAEFLPLAQLRDERLNELPNSMSTKNILDRANHTRVHFVWRKSHYVAPVTAQSVAYAGRCTEEVERLAPAEWKSLSKVLDKHALKTWEELTPEEFTEIKDALWSVANVRSKK